MPHHRDCAVVQIIHTPVGHKIAKPPAISQPLAMPKPSAAQTKAGPPDSSALKAAKQFETISDGADKFMHTVQAISAWNAFRQYDWLKDVPVKNASGNLRGMVVSERWGSAFSVVKPWAEKAGDLAFVASFAVNVVEQADAFEKIYQSNDSWEIKGAKYSIHVSSIAAKTLGGVVQGGVHVLALSLQGYCGLAASAMGQDPMHNRASNAVEATDKYITTTIDKVTDADNMYTAVTVYVGRAVDWSMGIKR